MLGARKSPSPGNISRSAGATSSRVIGIPIGNNIDIANNITWHCDYPASYIYRLCRCTNIRTASSGSSLPTRSLRAASSRCASPSLPSPRRSCRACDCGAELRGGAAQELVRLSIGIETVGDIIKDLDQALAA